MGRTGTRGAGKHCSAALNSRRNVRDFGLQFVVDGDLGLHSRIGESAGGKVGRLSQLFRLSLFSPFAHRALERGLRIIHVVLLFEVLVVHDQL